MKLGLEIRKVSSIGYKWRYIRGKMFETGDIERPGARYPRNTAFWGAVQGKGISRVVGERMLREKGR